VISIRAAISWRAWRLCRPIVSYPLFKAQRRISIALPASYPSASFVSLSLAIHLQWRSMAIQLKKKAESSAQLWRHQRGVMAGEASAAGCMAGSWPKTIS
jgi:hypothetical protein